MSSLPDDKLQAIIEAVLMVAGYPLNIGSLQQLFTEEERPTPAKVKDILQAIKTHHGQQSSIELQETASGYRLQTKAEYSPWLLKLWAERTPRYSRAFLETLAIIAYKQPITRAEIEDIRGVSVSGQIIKTLFEREWIKILGHREIPGRPALYGTTKIFLDYFNLTSLSQLPTLSELTCFEQQDERIQIELALEEKTKNLENNDDMALTSTLNQSNIIENQEND